MIVRPRIDVAATSRDFASVRPLVEEHIRYERSNTVVPDHWERVIAEQVSAGGLVIFVARIDESAVGYASITSDMATWSGERFGHLDCLYVDKNQRGGGLGRLLVEAVSAAARARDLHELQWQTPEWNADAIRFYERFGAVHRTKTRFTLAI